MSNKKETWVSDENKRIIGKDTTEYHKDGSSTTTHQKAHSTFFGAEATKITGVTENKPDGTSEHHDGSKSSCFLTSACVAHAGLNDDCQELKVLRGFRDGYIAGLPQGSAVLQEYYDVAPALVDRIEQSADRNTTLSQVFVSVTKAVTLIEGGRYQEAFVLYQVMFADLKQRYLA